MKTQPSPYSDMVEKPQDERQRLSDRVVALEEQLRIAVRVARDAESALAAIRARMT